MSVGRSSPSRRGPRCSRSPTSSTRATGRFRSSRSAPGLRPEEFFGLHRSDVDREAGLVHVRRRFSQGVLKHGGKTAGSERSVPLRPLVIDALAELPPRVDTPILFPAPRGGYIDLERFRFRAWAPALRAAGIEHRRVYDCRHTFATWAIEDDVQLSYLATIMGTSVVQIEDTYARWLKRTDEHLREVFAAGDARRLGPGVGPKAAQQGYADERT
jgi:integrase